MNLRRRRPVRPIAALAAAALALSVAPIIGASPAGAADPPPPLADPIGEGNFCEGAPAENPFTDLGAESEGTRLAILCLVHAQLTAGLTPTTYGPGAPVTRRQMAVFIKRLADLMVQLDDPEDGIELQALPDGSGGDDFTDIGAGEQADSATAIAQLSEAGIVGGFPDGTYRPNEPVSRRQMAAFINRLQDYLTGSPYPATGDYFDDDEGDPGEGNLNAVASVGIFQGDGQGNVSPNGNITRRQMANILLRNAQVHFAFGTILGVFDQEPEPETNQDFTVTPATNQTTEIGTVTQFSVSGISSAVVDIALVPCENITTDADGVSTFPNSSNPGGTGNVAALTGVDPDIDVTVINGTAVSSDQYADNVTVVNGGVTFTVSNGDDDCYVAVVFADADNDNNLDLGTDNAPTEAFGNSGDITVVPAEAADNVGVTGPVAALDKANDLFTNGTVTYYYDSNDEFLLEAGAVDTALTMEQFEARISAGDGISGTYRNSPANQSSFTLDDTAPAAPGGVVAQAPDGTNAGKAGIEVEFSDSATATVAKYDVFRATATQPTITGQPVTCPTVASGAYADIGDVADQTPAPTPYQFVDSAATPPAAGSTPPNPQYCYYVVAVDATGDTGPASTIAGPQQATAGDTSGAPEFASATAEAGTTAVVVNYDENIQATSTDANASNYAVTVTRGGVTTALTEVSTTDVDDDTVSITVSGIPGGTFQAGDQVIVTAQNGADGNTVLDTTNVAQPVGDAVQAVAADTTGPTATAASADGTIVVFTFNEDIDCTTYAEGPDIELSVDTETISSSTCSEASNTVSVTLDDAIDSGESVTFVADGIDDTSGNSGPPTDVTYSA